MRIVSRSVLLLLFALVLLSSVASFAQIGISVRFGPPALPVYVQPVCPAPGYMWTPGYWAWDPDIDDYYWVPGTWVLAPEVGFFWTPPWWGWEGGVYLFHAGWWGPHIGFYGGINYGFGYFGTGFVGGRWDGGQFFYNRSVTNINVTNIHNVYNTTVVNNNVTVNRVSYNGGEGGITARPTAEEQAAANERHIAPVAAQTEHIQAARSNPQLRASVNHGKPAIAATPKPGAFNEKGVVKAKEAGAPYTPRPAGGAGGERPANNVPRPPANHASEVQPHERIPAPNTGDAKLDQKYQQQQDKLYNKMQQEHQQLQQKQEQEHQKAQQRNYNQQQQQQMEQRHQQQTQQMEQRHQQQIQHMQQQQSRPPGRK